MSDPETDSFDGDAPYGPDTREARRLAERLALLIRASGRSLRSLEQELGLSSSMLSKMLNGTMRLQVAHVFMILRALGVGPGIFFRWAFPAEPRTSSLIDKVRASEESLHHRAPDEDAADFEARVEKVVRRVVRELMSEQSGTALRDR